MAQSAVRLGVSQRVLETEYYIVDLPRLLHYKTQMIAEDRLMTLQIATMSQCTDKDAYGRFVDHLRANIAESDGNKTEERLDRSALERLRSRVNSRKGGGN